MTDTQEDTLRNDFLLSVKKGLIGSDLQAAALLLGAVSFVVGIVFCVQGAWLSCAGMFVGVGVWLVVAYLGANMRQNSLVAAHKKRDRLAAYRATQNWTKHTKPESLLSTLTR